MVGNFTEVMDPSSLEKHHQNSTFVITEHFEDDSLRSDTSDSLRSRQTVTSLSGFRLFTVILSLVLGAFLVAIDISIVSVAIPKISTEFKALNDIGWYGSAYLLTVASFQPVAGKVYKLFSTRYTFLLSIVIFEVGSVLCATAPSSKALIFGRAVAGVGAAGVIQGAFGIITLVVPLQKRPVYIGIVGSTFGISACVSPTIGGALTDRAGWRWNFWVNLPLGAVAFVLLFIFLNVDHIKCQTKDLSAKSKLLHLDPIGVAVLISMMLSILLALQWGGSEYPWNDARIIALLCAFGALLVSFVLVEWKMGDNATILFSIARNRTVLAGSISLFFMSASQHIKVYYMPFYFQAAQGTTAIESGVRFLPSALPQTVGVVLAGALTSATGYYLPIMFAGTIVCAIGTGLLITLTVSTPTVLWAIYMVTAGLGEGICCNMPYTAIQVIFKDEADVFIGNAITTFSTLAGGGIGVGIGSNILRSVLFHDATDHHLSINPEGLRTAGPLGLINIAHGAPDLIKQLRETYAAAISATNIGATAAICLAVLATLGMQWKNVKKEAALRGSGA